jgi:cobalamin-dependent methionine synthase I
MLDDVLAPAMHSIGSLWQTAEVTVDDEHRATRICHRLLAELGVSLQSAPRSSRETVLLVTPEREHHELGLLMAGAVLHGAGYDTVLLGSGVPAPALTGALLRHRPAVVAISSSMPGPAGLSAAAGLVHETLPNTRLVIGGATARQLPPHVAARYVGRLDGLLDAVDAVLAPIR